MTRTSFDGCVIWRCANKHRNKTYIFLKILDCTVFSGTIIVSTSEISTIAVVLLLTEIKNFRRQCSLRWYGIYSKFNRNKSVVAEAIWGGNYAHTGNTLVHVSLERNINWKEIINRLRFKIFIWTFKDSIFMKMFIKIICFGRV